MQTPNPAQQVFAAFHCPIFLPIPDQYNVNYKDEPHDTTLVLL